jgi:hypothetical protein
MITLPVSAQESEPEDSESKEPESKDEKWARLTKEGLDCNFSVYGNLASWALNGQTLNFEYGKRSSIALRLRFLNLGLLNRTVFNHNVEEKFSPGFGLALRRYVTRREGTLRGYFLGIVIEHHIFRATQIEFDWIAGALVPSVETGYRWIVGRTVIGLGAGIGWAFQVYEHNEYWFGYSTDENRQGLTALTGLVLDGIVEIGGVF